MQRLQQQKVYDSALEEPIVTHQLCEPGSDRVTGTLHYFGMNNHHNNRVCVVFVPCYLDGNDGIFNQHYYDFLSGVDLSIYPSYYEPWGYTPLESIAFKVPCVTTSLSGFGVWAASCGHATLATGVEVIRRTDYNYDEVAESICGAIIQYSRMSTQEVSAARKAAGTLARDAQWKHFIQFYYQAYDVALQKAELRQQDTWIQP